MLLSEIIALFCQFRTPDPYHQQDLFSPEIQGHERHSLVKMTKPILQFFPIRHPSIFFISFLYPISIHLIFP